MSPNPEYIEVELKVAEGTPLRLWRCGTCGSVITTADRVIHDVWHDQLDVAIGPMPA
jgi:hypothetical protein